MEYDQRYLGWMFDNLVAGEGRLYCSRAAAWQPSRHSYRPVCGVFAAPWSNSSSLLTPEQTEDMWCRPLLALLQRPIVGFDTVRKPPGVETCIGIAARPKTRTSDARRR